MLIKVGRVGEVVKEYFLPNNSKVSDALDAHDLDYNNDEEEIAVHQGSDVNGGVSERCLLHEGDVVVVEPRKTPVASELEEKIADFIEDYFEGSVNTEDRGDVESLRELIEMIENY